MKKSIYYKIVDLEQRKASSRDNKLLYWWYLLRLWILQRRNK